MNYVNVRFLFYLCISLLYSTEIYSASSKILYPTFTRIVDQLLNDSTLPECTLTTCQQTETQANFANTKVSHKLLLKLSSYGRVNQTPTSLRQPYLITSTGIYRGKRIKYYKRYVDQFLGIYYGEIPKSLRKPVMKIFNYSLQNATKFTPSCLQSLSMTRNLSYGPFVMKPDFNEDCLSLNIYRPDLRYGEKQKAIMLFSHGGSNQLGSGSLFDGSILASEGDIIIVTMNFRLNFHGFLSSGDDLVKGNYGLWDQLLAVEWIYENAHLFGGDRNRITLAGHSAGAGNVMLIPASPFSRGMIRRVISQSGTGLAPWSINRTPMKLLERFSQDICCNHSDPQQSIACIHQLLDNNAQDIYHLQISLTIADDNPYPVIDQDFINDTIENILQGDTFNNIDFLTGVTLNEGLYFAEYHIKNFYNDLQLHNSFNKSFLKNKCSNYYSNVSGIIPPDIVFKESQALKMKNSDDQKYRITNTEQRLDIEPASNNDSYLHLEHFIKLNYTEQYIAANFENGQCFIDEVKRRYELPAHDNATLRLQLFIDLVSDLMFNFHMVRCLNLLSEASNRNASNYAYIYSHLPTSKVLSTYRDQLKLLPQAIGHFAELDYVFGVPLARNYSRIHRNVNKNFYNYSADEENFSRQMIRYWSNFVKTGNPNKGSLSTNTTDIEWLPYTKKEHNYLELNLNSIHHIYNYFDDMYNFWLQCFQIESQGGCQKHKIRKHLISFIIVLVVLFILLMIYLLWKYFQEKRKGHLFWRRSSPNLLASPNLVSA